MNRRKKFTHVLTAFCAGGLILSSFAEDIVTLSGRSYKNCEIRNITDRAVDILHDTGAASIPFEDLPEKFISTHSDVEKKLKEKQEKKLAAEKARQEELKKKLAAEKARQEETERERQLNLRKMEQEHKQLAEEQAKKELFMKALFSGTVQVSESANREKIAPLPNIVFIEGTNGSGTGFKMQFGKEKVIVSNAHVFLALVNPRIRDASGNDYKIEQILSSTTRDLVLLKYTPVPKEASVLRMAPDVLSVPTNSPVVAFGNSQGASVSTTLPGNLLGVGYDIIEVSAGVVGGNSGGPVVLQSTGEVIGVVTFLTIRTITPQMTNTRFATPGESYSVRRFATRIDNLKAAEFENLTDTDLNTERTLLVEMENASRNLSDMISDISKNRNSGSLDKIRSYLKGIDSMVRKGDGHVWSSTYLSKEYQREKVYIKTCSNILKVDNLILASNLRKVWEANEIKVQTVNTPALSRVCKSCNGSGQVEEARVQRSIREGGAFAKDYRTCDRCNGTGKIVESRESSRQEYDVPVSALESFQNLIRKSKRDFNGFMLGGKSQEEIARFPYYNRAHLLKKEVNQLEYVYVFKGNHRISEASETRLSFVFGCLLKVQVVIPYSSHAAQYFRNYIKDNFSNLEDVYEVECVTDGNGISISSEHDAYHPSLPLISVGSVGSGRAL